jgi:protein PhnA
MARGLDEHRERQSIVNLLGKALARRSRSRCELCEASGVPLSVFEVPPELPEPSPDAALFLCEECRSQLDNPRQFDATRWRFLTESIWSEIPAVQVLAVRLLRRLCDREDWAADALEDLYLDEDVEAWIAQAE